MSHRLNCFLILCLAVIATVLNCGASARAGVLRVVTYNIDAGTGDQSGRIGGPIAGPGLTTILQDISNKHIGGTMRYLLQPIGGTARSQFYLYVSHAKSGTGTSNANRRNVETPKSAMTLKRLARRLTSFSRAVSTSTPAPSNRIRHSFRQP
jgi:hypothetical protein